MKERKCPTCNETMTYKNVRKFKIAISNNTECRSCCKKGKKNPAFGKPGSMLGRPGISGELNPAKRKEVREKISRALTGKPSGMLGKTHSADTKEKQRAGNVGQKRNADTISKIKIARKKQVGSACPNWKGGVSIVNHGERIIFCNTIEYKNWRTSVFERDNYTCLICHTRGGNLHAHHIKDFATYKNLRITVSNGATLCIKCHKEFHRKYGLSNLPNIFNVA